MCACVLFCSVLFWMLLCIFLSASFVRPSHFHFDSFVRPVKADERSQFHFGLKFVSWKFAIIYLFVELFTEPFSRFEPLSILFSFLLNFDDNNAHNSLSIVQYSPFGFFFFFVGPRCYCFPIWNVICWTKVSFFFVCVCVRTFVHIYFRAEILCHYPNQTRINNQWRWNYATPFELISILLLKRQHQHEIDAETIWIGQNVEFCNNSSTEASSTWVDSTKLLILWCKFVCVELLVRSIDRSGKKNFRLRIMVRSFGMPLLCMYESLMT